MVYGQPEATINAAGVEQWEKDIRDHQFAFIGGLHKSGTSFLHECLKTHPAISGFSDTGAKEDEGQHLQSVYPAVIKYGGAGKFGFDKRSWLDETSPLITPENRKRLFEEWQPYWDFDKPVLIEKSPGNLVRVRFFQALFPGAAFITITRHPVAVALATEKWARTSTIYRLVRHWFVCHEKFVADRPRLERCLVLKYEDLIEQPQQQLNAIYRFLNLAPHELQLSVRKNINRAYIQRWEKYKRSWWSGWLGRKIIRDFKAPARQFGYDIEHIQ